jgi:DnaJ-class molecular chaperone
MSGRYYERDEDWLITCPKCHGNGTIGTGVSRIKCPKCKGAGRIKQE